MLATGFRLLFALCACLSHAETLIDCGDPPLVENASIEEKDAYPPGSEVEYSCDFGYTLSGHPRTITCKYFNDTDTTEWSELGIHCVPRSCGDPGYVNNARRSGSVFTFASRVEYACHEGYKLEGNAQRFCQTTGKWSGRLPTCTKIQCEIPEGPENGRAVYDSAEYGAELQYECDKGFLLQSEGQQICSEDGHWSGSKPKCVETFCNHPNPPLHGTMDLVSGKVTVGSIVIYSCDEGYSMHGSKTSKCFATGEWTFPPPTCEEPCKVPEVEQGIFGIYETGRFRKTFKQLQVNSVLNDGQEVYLRCAKNYEPLGRPVAEMKISCSKGIWSIQPLCKPASCRMKPPSVPNARLITAGNQNGTTLTYNCNDGFVKSKYGSMTCKYGSWIGKLPTCKDMQCYQKDLNFSGLIQSNKKNYLPQSTLIPQCADGYELSNPSSPNLSCINAVWKGTLPPCEPARCKGAPPHPPNGLITSFSSDHGSTATVSCQQGFQLSNRHALPRCSYGKWETNPDACTDTRCYVKDLKQNEGVDVSSSDPVNNNEYGNIKCLEGFSLAYGQPLCSNGIWKFNSNISPCKPDSCVVHHLNHGEFQYPKTEHKYNWRTVRYDAIVNYFKESIGLIHDHGNELYVACKTPFVFHGERSATRVKVRCQRGKWVPRPLCLRVGEQMPVENKAKIPVSTIATYVVTRSALSQTSMVTSSWSTPATEFSSMTSTQSAKLSTTTKEEEIEAFTAVFSNSSLSIEEYCSCIYNYADEDVIAFAGMELLHFGSLVKEGCNVTFFCKFIGSDHLVGNSELQCTNCTWSAEKLPSCEKPKRYDAVITMNFLDSSLLSFERDVIFVPYGMGLNISCRILGTTTWAEFVNLPAFIIPKYRYIERETDQLLYTDLIIEHANSSYDGKYECYSYHGHSNHITIQVAELSCPEIKNESFVVTYSHQRRLHSKAHFQCLDDRAILRGSAELLCLSTGLWSGDPPVCESSVCPMLIVPDKMTAFYSKERSSNSQALFTCQKPYVLQGQQVITCLANGRWSGQVPKCEYVSCATSSLQDVLPEDVVPVEEDVTSPEVPYGESLRLQCSQSNRHPIGVQNATCSKSGSWIIENISCVLGCNPLVLPENSKLIVEPSKTVYRFGEFVTFSCPSGFILSTSVVKMMCLKDGWSEEDKYIPTCSSI